MCKKYEVTSPDIVCWIKSGGSVPNTARELVRKKCSLQDQLQGLIWSECGIIQSTIFPFQRDSSCPSLVVSCPTFEVKNKKSTCRGPKDYLSLGSQRYYCYESEPNALQFLQGSARGQVQTTSPSEAIG